MGSHVLPLYLRARELFIFMVHLSSSFTISFCIRLSLSLFPFCLTFPFTSSYLPSYIPFSIFLPLFHLSFSCPFPLSLTLSYFASLSPSVFLFSPIILSVSLISSCFPSLCTSSRTEPWLVQARRGEKPCARLMALRGYHGNSNPVESPHPAERPFILEKHYKNGKFGYATATETS